jgi:signal transduction histidine kinase
MAQARSLETGEKRRDPGRRRAAELALQLRESIQRAHSLSVPCRLVSTLWPMRQRATQDDLAEALIRTMTGQRAAGRALHDEVGPLLSAAGLRLHLLTMDFPDASERAREVMEALDDTMERVRALSQELNPSPVYRTGFKNALGGLVDVYRQRFPGKIQFAFTSSAKEPLETAVAMYEAAAAALAQAVESPGATKIAISRHGSRKMSVRVKSNGRGGSGGLAMAALLARHAGLTFDATTGNGTIVSIRHAGRRTSRG